MISLVMGCFRMTDMRLRVESKGSTCSTSKSMTRPSPPPGSDTDTVAGVRFSSLTW